MIRRYLSPNYAYVLIIALLKQNLNLNQNTNIFIQEKKLLKILSAK